MNQVGHVLWSSYKMSEPYKQGGLYILGNRSQVRDNGDAEVMKQGGVYRNGRHSIKVRGNQTA